MLGREYCDAESTLKLLLKIDGWVNRSQGEPSVKARDTGRTRPGRPRHISQNSSRSLGLIRKDGKYRQEGEKTRFELKRRLGS